MSAALCPPNLFRSYGEARPLLLEQPSLVEAMVEGFLAQAEGRQDLNAFVRLYREEALSRAREVGAELGAQQVRPLSGMVVGLKDLFCYKGHPVEASSKILEGFVSQITATSVERLMEGGAIILGHQNCDEFGMGSSNLHSKHGRAKNFLAPHLSSGGSSGGSAVGVQAGKCHVALGTDTGGSVRQPAALTGVVGLKPTYARISRYGVIAYASSFDTVGILANKVEDCGRVLGVISGADERDNTCSSRPVEDYLAPWSGQKKLRIAYLEEALQHPRLQKEVKVRTEVALRRLREQGAVVTGVRFPLLDYALPAYYVLTTAEASSNLARYDGVRYGVRARGVTSVRDLYTRTRTLGFGTEVKRRILLGTFILSAGYQDAYYTQAQRVRRMVKEALEKILEAHDFILLPTTPTTAFAPEEHAADPVMGYLADLYTVLASVGGLPAISLPNGVDNQGLPVGLQVVGKHFEERALLGFSQYLLDSALAS